MIRIRFLVWKANVWFAVFNALTNMAFRAGDAHGKTNIRVMRQIELFQLSNEVKRLKAMEKGE